MNIIQKCSANTNCSINLLFIVLQTIFGWLCERFSEFFDGFYNLVARIVSRLRLGKYIIQKKKLKEKQVYVWTYLAHCKNLNLKRWITYHMIIRLLRATISMRQDSVNSVYTGITFFLQNQILTADGRSSLGKTEEKIPYKEMTSTQHFFNWHSLPFL